MIIVKYRHFYLNVPNDAAIINYYVLRRNLLATNDEFIRVNESLTTCFISVIRKSLCFFNVAVYILDEVVCREVTSTV